MLKLGSWHLRYTKMSFDLDASQLRGIFSVFSHSESDKTVSKQYNEVERRRTNG